VSNLFIPVDPAFIALFDDPKNLQLASLSH